MKQIVFTILVFLIVFLIYCLNINKKIYYLSVGDYLSNGIDNFENSKFGYSENIKEHYKKSLKNYVNYSNIDDYRVMDLINDINYNKTIRYNNKEYRIQNLLVKANLITISIGMNDLIYKKNLNYDYIDNLLSDIDNLFIIVRKYNKDKIFFLGFYNIINNQELIEYANKRLINICKKNEIYYVDISILDKYIINSVYPTKEGYIYITDRILSFTKK